MLVGLSADDFLPYASFAAADEELGRFVDLSLVSFSLAQQLLFATPQAVLPPVALPTVDWDGMSYGEHSFAVEGIEPAAEWLTLDEHSARSGVSVEQLAERAATGILGPQENVTDSPPRYVWPSSYATRARDEIPETAQIRATVKPLRHWPEFDLQDPNSFDEAQRTYLTLAHALGEPQLVRERAELMLIRAAFLVLWTNFEVFLRETVADLFGRHPEMLARGKRGGTKVEYGELEELSAGFTSASELQQALVAREIQRVGDGGHSVNGLITFLKQEFWFGSDPYEAEYSWRGEKRVASFEALQRVRKLRNALVHEGEPPVDSLSFDKDQFAEIRLMLNSVAYRITAQVVAEDYGPRG